MKQKGLIRLLCLVAAIWLSLSGGTARADEVSCPGRSPGYRCFRADSGTGQIAGWIADINRRIPADQDRVELRHYDNTNLAKNWLWCRVNGRTVNPVRNFEREVPMSTTDYQQAYCPTGEVLRWVRQGHVYRVPVSAIPTPGERNTILATELTTRLLSDDQPTREELVSALSALESNETDMQGMRPDRQETAALIAAIRRSFESLPDVVVTPSEPVVREVVRQGEVVTIEHVNEGIHYPWWLLMVMSLGLVAVGILLGLALGSRRYGTAARALERERHQVSILLARNTELDNRLTQKPSTELVLAAQVKAERWDELHKYYDETYLQEKGISPRDVDAFSADRMKRMVENGLMPSREREILAAWNEAVNVPFTIERFEELIRHGAAFERSKEQSGKKPMEEFLSSFGEDSGAVPLMKAEITRLNEEAEQMHGSVLEVARLTEWLQSLMRRVQNFSRGFGVNLAEHPMPDLKNEDGITDFVQGIFDDISHKLRLRDEIVADKNQRRDERSKQLRHHLRTGIKRHRELVRQFANYQVEIPVLREQISSLSFRLNDEMMKTGKMHGLQFRVKELDQDLVSANEELEKSVLCLEGALSFIRQLSDGDLLKLYEGLELLKKRPDDHFGPQDRTVIVGLCTKAESVLESLMGFTPKAVPRSTGPNGIYASVPIPVGV